MHQCCISVPISDACQCPSVPPTSASSSVPISATYQCPSVQPISAASLAHIRDMYTDDQCALMISVAPAVPPVSAHQCQLSVLINATCQCPLKPHQCHI
ncbi:unnamed protein product, partial [Staurois parvus]